MIPFSKVSLGQEEIDAVTRVMKSGWLAAGPETEAFEKEFAEYITPKPADWDYLNDSKIPKYYCIFTNSCTSALKMAYKWAKEQGAKDMFYPINTFCATYSAGEEMGINMHKYTPISEMAMDYHDITRVNVHFGSVKDETPCLIEDSAHRIEPNDPLVGKIRCYSFYATKNMTTGSGGMFVTNDKEIYDTCRIYWKDGLTTSTADRASGNCDYSVVKMAGGYDGNDMAASIGRVQLKKLPQFMERRNEIVKRYNKAFGQTWEGNHLYPYFTKSEQEVQDFIRFMKDKGVQCSYHYPNTGWLGVSLPIYPLLTDNEIKYIIKCVKEWKCRF